MEFNATFIVSAISFIFFTVIMNAIFYKPLQKIVIERQSYIDDINNETKQNAKKTEAILKDKAKKLENAKHDARKVIATKTDAVKDKKSEMASAAQQQATGTIDLAKNDLQKSKLEAQNVLSNDVVNLAQDISSKILGENIPVQNVDIELTQKLMNEG